uniref:TF-B3 domain-containing protein n=1 Tax=Brassica campestris TaxID=3711 RepID=M4E6I7_BRACM
METPREPHFFKPLLPGFHSGVAIPLDFYSKHIQGAEINKPWKLRSDASDQIWEVIREGRTLTKGWKEFTEAHDLRIGDIVSSQYLKDMVFHVTPFGPSCCDIQYTHPHIVKEEADADDAPTFSYDYCFLAEVTPTNQKDDKMFLPVEAMRCGALNQQCKEVKLVNKEGKSWTARFGFSESDGAYYISRGWRKFCRDNRCTNGDLFVFNVVGDGTTTPLLCVCPERKECTELLIKHFSRIDEECCDRHHLFVSIINRSSHYNRSTSELSQSTEKLRCNCGVHDSIATLVVVLFSRVPKEKCCPKRCDLSLLFITVS